MHHSLPSSLCLTQVFFQKNTNDQFGQIVHLQVLSSHPSVWYLWYPLKDRKQAFQHNLYQLWQHINDFKMEWSQNVSIYIATDRNIVSSNVICQSNCVQMPREKGNVCVQKCTIKQKTCFASQRVYVCYTHVVLIGTDVVLNCLKYAFFVTMLHGAIIDIWSEAFRIQNSEYGQ